MCVAIKKDIRQSVRYSTSALAAAVKCTGLCLCMCSLTKIADVNFYLCNMLLVIWLFLQGARGAMQFLEADVVKGNYSFSNH